MSTPNAFPAENWLLVAGRSNKSSHSYPLVSFPTSQHTHARTGPALNSASWSQRAYTSTPMQPRTRKRGAFSKPAPSFPICFAARLASRICHRSPSLFVSHSLPNDLLCHFNVEALRRDGTTPKACAKPLTDGGPAQGEQNSRIRDFRDASIFWAFFLQSFC